MKKFIILLLAIFSINSAIAAKKSKIEIYQVEKNKNLTKAEQQYQIIKNEAKISELYQIISELKLQIEKLDLKQTTILNRLNVLNSKNGHIEATSTGNGREFNYAFSMLSKGNYDISKRAFNLFIEKYPKDPKIGEVYFWLGEIAYKEKKYKVASKNYLISYRDYKTHNRRDESLLKLSLSLNLLGRKQEACEGLLIIMAESNTASRAIKNRASNEMVNLGCRN
jgi:tol-pal system protein YbgF